VLILVVLSRLVMLNAPAKSSPEIAAIFYLFLFVADQFCPRKFLVAVDEMHRFPAWQLMDLAGFAIESGSSRFGRRRDDRIMEESDFNCCWICHNFIALLNLC
jgi:hypothetical protein